MSIRGTRRAGVRPALATAVALVASLACAVGLGAQPPDARPRPPQLAIEAPLGLAPDRSRLEAIDPARLQSIVELVGLRDPGPAIRVILADEASPLALQSPPDIGGFAVGREGLVVLFPARAPVYPDDTLEDVLRHEVAHVLIDRAAGGRHVPRWFHEGLAMAAERPWGLRDRGRLVYELALSVRVNVDEIGRLFSGGRASRNRAYTLSGALVRDLLDRHGSGMPALVLRRVAAGEPFETAFVRATGRTIGEAEAEFWQRRRFWTTWLPFLTSSSALWMLVTLLALYAIRRRRQKSAELRRRWDAEDGLYVPPPDEPRVH